MIDRKQVYINFDLIKNKYFNKYIKKTNDIDIYKISDISIEDSFQRTYIKIRMQHTFNGRNKSIYMTGFKMFECSYKLIDKWQVIQEILKENK